MKLPNGDLAAVDDAKVLGYILSETHPQGRDHAKLFRLLLGIDASNHQVLVSALKDAARNADAKPGKRSPYGQKFEVRFQMTARGRSFTVLSVWMIPLEDGVPRLVTAYVE